MSVASDTKRFLLFSFATLILHYCQLYIDGVPASEDLVPLREVLMVKYVLRGT